MTPGGVPTCHTAYADTFACRIKLFLSLFCDKIVKQFWHITIVIIRSKNCKLNHRNSGTTRISKKHAVF